MNVILHTALQAVTAEGRTSRVSLELPDGATVRQAMAKLEVNFPTEELLLVVNRQVVEEDAQLQDGDVLDLIPALSGG